MLSIKALVKSVNTNVDQGNVVVTLVGIGHSFDAQFAIDEWEDAPQAGSTVEVEVIV